MALHEFCGLDFGTSNSTIGIHKDNQIAMVPLENGKPPIRSAIFFDYDAGRRLFGQQGVQEYLLGTHGRLMVSLKSILGSSLMQETTQIDNRPVPYADILGFLIKHLKVQAERLLGHELTQVVMGRPVRFHDEDDKRDRLAQETLESVAKKQGFKTLAFQYEPIAAALAYEQTIQKEQLALIVDLGGGTSDFSVIRLKGTKDTRGTKGTIRADRSDDVLSNKGIHIGGTDFDTLFSLHSVMPELGLGGEMKGMSGNIQIPSSYYHDLTTWHTINGLYTHKARKSLQEIWNFALDKKPIERLIHVVERQQGHKILNEIEQAKCKLSAMDKIDMNLSFIEKGYQLTVERTVFEEIIRLKVTQLIATIKETLKDANIKAEAIEALFFTGGTTEIPMIREKIINLFPNAEIVRGDVFSSVGKGLIIDAQRKFA